MNLLDVIPISSDAFPMQVSLEGLSKLDEQKRRLEVIRAAKTLTELPGEKNALEAMEKRTKQKYYDDRIDFFGDNLSLPEGHYTEDGPFHRAMQAPKVRLSAVRDIADRIGFVAMPFAYLNPRSYDAPEENDMAQTFSRKIGPAADIYALAPVRFYSVERHVSAEKDGEIYAPEFLRQAFMAVDMVVPMFRAMTKEVASMKSRFETELKNLGKRVDGLQALVEKHIRETLEKIARQEQEHARQMRALEARAFVREDPLLLALPRGASIQSSNAYAILGPCWGPDAPDILFEAANLARVDGQRERLMAFQKGWSTLPTDTKETAAKALQTNPQTMAEMSRAAGNDRKVSHTFDPYDAFGPKF